MFYWFSFKKWLAEAINTPVLTTQYKKKFPQALPEEITAKIQLAASADPTPNNTYTSWIFKELINNRIRLPEDTNVVKQQLELFNKSKPALKRMGKQIDIDKYDKNQLWQALGELQQSGVISGRQAVEKIKREGAEELYRDDEWLLMKMTKGEACSYYARGTKWCTSDPKVADNYLEEGPIYIIYHKGKVYAQFHIESGQFMDPQDVEIPHEKVPDKLKEIIKDYVPVSDEYKKKKYKMFGIKEKVITYPDGHFWGTGDFENFILASPEGEEVTIDATRGIVNRVYEKDFYTLIRKSSTREIEKEYKAAHNWNAYIVDFLIKKPDLVKHINPRNEQWNFSDLSDEQRQKLLKYRPDLFPRVELKTSDGNMWTHPSGQVDSIGQLSLLVNSKFRPILSFLVNNSHTHIEFGSWSNLGTHSIINNEETNKTDYSRSTVEFIMENKIQYMVYHRNNSYTKFEWKFEDLTTEDQQHILKKYPDFNDPIAIAEKTSHNVKEFVAKLDALELTVSFAALDDDNVIVDRLNVIDERTIISGRGGIVGSGVAYALSNKIQGIHTDDSGYEFQKLSKEGDFSALKQKFPFADQEMMDLSREHGYKTDDAISHAVGKKMMDKFIQILYNKLKQYENEEFKVVLQDNRIYFITSLENLKQEFKKNKTFKLLLQRYRNWYQSIKINPKELIHEIEKLPKEVDKQLFKKVISGQENYYTYRH